MNKLQYEPKQYMAGLGKPISQEGQAALLESEGPPVCVRPSFLQPAFVKSSFLEGGQPACLKEGEPAFVNSSLQIAGPEEARLSEPQVRTVEQRVQDLLEKVNIAHYSTARAKILNSMRKGLPRKLEKFYKTLFSSDNSAHNLEYKTLLDEAGMFRIILEIMNHVSYADSAIDKPIFSVVFDLLKQKAISKEDLETLDSTTMKKIEEKLIRSVGHTHCASVLVDSDGGIDP